MIIVPLEYTPPKPGLFTRILHWLAGWHPPERKQMFVLVPPRPRCLPLAAFGLARGRPGAGWERGENTMKTTVNQCDGAWPWQVTP